MLKLMKFLALFCTILINIYGQQNVICFMLTAFQQVLCLYISFFLGGPPYLLLFYVK